MERDQATKFIYDLLRALDGNEIEVVYQQAEPLDSIRHTLVQAGYDKAVVVYFGSERDVLVRLLRDADAQAVGAPGSNPDPLVLAGPQ